MTIRRNTSEDNDKVRLDDGVATLRVRELQNAAVISRRGVLWRAGLATAAGAAALTALDEQRANAATGGSFLLGETNDASSATTLKTTPGTIGFSQLMSLDASTNITVSALDVTGPPDGNAINGHVAGAGSGVAGSSASGPGLTGSSSTGVGVVGTSTNNDAVHGTATANGKTGVLGTDTSTTGGTGVYGTSANGVGVHASSGGGTALSVSGKVHFSRSGHATVASGTKTKTVTVSTMTSSSLVLVTLQNTATGIYIAGAVPASGKFTVHLNNAAPTNMKFAWFILSG